LLPQAVQRVAQPPQAVQRVAQPPQAVQRVVGQTLTSGLRVRKRV
jgi:hypothetical protein